MKNLPALLLICTLAAAAFAQDTAQKKMPPASADAKADAMIPASKAKVTAPMTLKDGVISQPERTEIAKTNTPAVFD